MVTPQISARFFPQWFPGFGTISGLKRGRPFPPRGGNGPFTPPRKTLFFFLFRWKSLNQNSHPRRGSGKEVPFGIMFPKIDVHKVPCAPFCQNVFSGFNRLVKIASLSIKLKFFNCSTALKNSISNSFKSIEYPHLYNSAVSNVCPQIPIFLFPIRQFKISDTKPVASGFVHISRAYTFQS